MARVYSFQILFSKDENNTWIKTQQTRKNLETIDGVEIASSYKEYLDLALGDLEDRLKKASVKLLDFKNREIKNEE